MIETICRKYGIDLVDVEIERDYHQVVNMPEDHFINHSFSIDGQIILGIYEDAELRLASFLHELGHKRWRCIKSDFSSLRFFDEVFAWNYAMRFIQKHGIIISNRTKQWCRTQLLTYLKNESKEEIEKSTKMAFLLYNNL